MEPCFFSEDYTSSGQGISDTEIAENDPRRDDKVSSSDFYTVEFFKLFMSVEFAVSPRERDSSKLA